MTHLLNPELEIQKLQAQLQQQHAEHCEAMERKNKDLARTRLELSQLQSSVQKSQLPQSPSSLDVSAPVNNEFRVSTSTLPHGHDGLWRSSNTIPPTAGVGAHSRCEEPPPRPSNHHSTGAHGVRPSRTMSQQVPSSQKMDRTASNLSTRSAGPFVINCPISPPPAPRNSSGAKPRSRVRMASTDRDELLNARIPDHPMPTLTELPNTGNMWNPSDWLEAQAFDETSPMADAFGPADLPPYYDGDVPQFNVTNVSVCGSMTTAPTYDTTPMTRQNSLFEEQSVSGGVQMLRLDSQMSQGADSFPVPGSDGSSPLGKRAFANDHALFAVGANLAPPSAHQYTASVPNDGLLASADMERSLSSTSMASSKSSCSLKARAKDTLLLQNQRAKNAPLQPKPQLPQGVADAQVDEKKDGTTVVVKTKYVRPRQAKVFCDQCEEHKEGFRGDHELRRHKDAKHKDMVRKWICVDPSELGLPIGVPVVNPLSKCKACKKQKKYGAYYNVAAHLRRTHFKEKPIRQKNKGSSGRGRADENKRGGKGGGDWPAMSELKNWMKEVWVNKFEQPAEEDEDGEDDFNPLPSGDTEMNSDPIEGFPPEFAMSQGMIANGMTTVDCSFPNGLTLNTDVAYPMPISSADFDFSSSSAISSSFPPNMMMYSLPEPMGQYSSAVSNTATITPATAYNPQLDDLPFEMGYSQ
ncbi:hypothetical protein GGR56DRAFT_668650 [Xylariaceae sp. FL0804]|nr:hypothetical protein GGR56DRAFT_668650 [Xylariaceae sp. FL0804]